MIFGGNSANDAQISLVKTAIVNLQKFVTSEFGTRLWMSLGHWLPPRAGHGVAKIIAALIGRYRRGNLYRILYDNQAVVLGPDAPPEAVHAAVRRVLRHVGQTAYDLTRTFALGKEAIANAVAFDDDFWSNLAAARATGRGVMMCGCHTSNFNLGFLALSTHDIPQIQVLSVPTPTGGFRVMHELRHSAKIDETPIDRGSLRNAITRLRNGGFVATGVDWPLAAAPDDIMTFFGRPARLPTGHIRLALSAGAVLLPLACRWDPVRGYYAQTAAPLTLEITGNQAVDILHNAQRVLSIIEGWIAETPEQWLMYYRVWPKEEGLSLERK